jgi:DNA-binding MarR family transcriptional regulator
MNSLLPVCKLVFHLPFFPSLIDLLARFKASNHRRTALLALLEHGNLTDYELADKTGLQQNSIGKRRKDCQDAGLVTHYRDDDGNKVKRPAPSGSKAYVWMLTDRGEELANQIKREL